MNPHLGKRKGESAQALVLWFAKVLPLNYPRERLAVVDYITEDLVYVESTEDQAFPPIVKIAQPSLLTKGILSDKPFSKSPHLISFSPSDLKEQKELA